MEPTEGIPPEQEKVPLAPHAEAAAAFDRKGAELLGKTQIQPPKPPRREQDLGFVSKVTIRREDMLNFTESMQDVSGAIVSKFRDVDGKMVGFGDSSYAELRRLAQSVQRNKVFEEFVSQRAVENSIFDWALEQRGKAEPEGLTQFLLTQFRGQVRREWFWIPVRGLASEYQFELGPVTITPITESFFATWEAGLRTRKAWDDKSEAMVHKCRSEFRGHAACTLYVTAEPNRAREIALNMAEDALAILRLVQPAILHPHVSSHIRPWGREHILGSEFMVVHDDLARVEANGEDDFRTWVLDKDMLEIMAQSGLGAIKDLVHRGTRSAYEDDLWRSLWTYSQSSLQKSPEDRLIYVFRALESFLLRDGSENIQQNIGERMAFTIADEAEGRQGVVRTVKAVYGLRSANVHHNQSIEETELLTSFLSMVFKTFLLLVGRAPLYSTRADLFAWVDGKKYG